MIVAATHYYMTVKSYNSFKEKTVLSMYVLLLIQRAVPRVGAPGGTLRQRSLCICPLTHTEGAHQSRCFRGRCIVNGSLFGNRCQEKVKFLFRKMKGCIILWMLVKEI